jgi:hypothetical protein
MRMGVMIMMGGRAQGLEGGHRADLQYGESRVTIWRWGKWKGQAQLLQGPEEGHSNNPQHGERQAKIWRLKK